MEYTQGLAVTTKYKLSLLLPLSLLLGFLLFHYSDSPNLPFSSINFSLFSKTSLPQARSCAGRYIYVYDLPSRFNYDLLHECKTLCLWTDMCRFVSNSGLGPELNETESVLPKIGWYGTNQFTLEIIFHNRMKQYRCLTTNSSIANAIFIPFYAGLDIGRYLWGYNNSVRDSLSMGLIQWLRSRPEWEINGGRDHFFVSGRILWDFWRQKEEDSIWGSKFLLLPETKNMTVLSIESIPFERNEIGIPYPTYFHPSNLTQVVTWQEKVRLIERAWLFSFAGARRPNQSESIRDQLMDQCSNSERCNLLECDYGENNCNSPSTVMKLFQSSTFCLQPAGDSFTRRSVFDSMLAGCIPVFFHPGTAYIQYVWYLPRDHTKYSVFIPENEVREGKVKIEEVLLRYSEEQVREMREKVIEMVPLIVYKDPNSKLSDFRDAFDVAIDGMIERMRETREGKLISFMIEEEERDWGWFFGRTN